MENSNILNSVYDPHIINNTPEPTPDDAVCLSYENTIRALCALSPLAFFFYMFFALSSKRDSFTFPATAFCEATGLPYEEYMAAYNELLNDRFLVPTTVDPAIFYFHDCPLKPQDPHHPDYPNYNEQIPWDDEDTSYAW